MTSSVTPHRFAQRPSPIELAGYGVRLVPLSLDHTEGLQAAAADGELWHLRVTSVPEPENTTAYIQAALDGQANGTMLPFAVLDAGTGVVLGSTRYHDIIPEVARLEIGYTWYAARCQRTHVNTACKLLLLRTPSIRWVAPWWAGEPTTSISSRNGPSNGWAHAKTASFATMPCDATAPFATRSCTA